MWPEIRLVQDGRTVVTDALVIAFFINQPHRDCAHGVAEAVDRFVHDVGLSSLGYLIDEDGDTHPLTPSVYRSLRAKLVESVGKEEGGIRLIGDDVHVTGASVHYYGQALPDQELPDWRNLLSFHVPRSLCVERGTPWMKHLARTVAAGVPFSFAYASPCVHYDSEFRVALGAARRYPGLDVLNQGAAAADIGDKAAGVYWMSFLGEGLSDAVGGAWKLREAVPLLAEVNELPAGATEVVVTSEPDVGDRNRQVDLPAYAQLARFLEPRLHIPEIAYFFTDDTLLPDREAMVAWHRRFLD